MGRDVLRKLRILTKTADIGLHGLFVNLPIGIGVATYGREENDDDSDDADLICLWTSASLIV